MSTSSSSVSLVDIIARLSLRRQGNISGFKIDEIVSFAPTRLAELGRHDRDTRFLQRGRNSAAKFPKMKSWT